MLILPCISSHRFFCTANHRQRHVAAAESTALRQEKNIVELSFELTIRTECDEKDQELPNTNKHLSTAWFPLTAWETLQCHLCTNDYVLVLCSESNIFVSILNYRVESV